MPISSVKNWCKYAFYNLVLGQRLTAELISSAGRSPERPALPSPISWLITWYRCLIYDLKDYYRSQPDTIYLVAFQKCGGTWLSFMLVQVLTRVYNLQVQKLTVDINSFTKKYPELPTIAWIHDKGEFTDEGGARPDPWRLFIYGGRFQFRKNRVILLIRDPRDIIVSLYHQVTKRSDRPMKFASLSEFVRHPLYGFRRIIRFYQIWYRNRWVPRDMLILRYEDLFTKGPRALAEVVKFINIGQVDRTLVKEIYEFSRADNMRKLEIAGLVEKISRRSFGTSQNTLKVRRAKIGSYKDELSIEDIAYCNRYMLNLPKIYGYTPNDTA